MTGEDIVQRAAAKLNRATAEIVRQFSERVLRTPENELYGDIELTAAIHKGEVKSLRVFVSSKIKD